MFTLPSLSFLKNLFSKLTGKEISPEKSSSLEEKLIASAEVVSPEEKKLDSDIIEKMESTQAGAGAGGSSLGEAGIFSAGSQGNVDSVARDLEISAPAGSVTDDAPIINVAAVTSVAPPLGATPPSDEPPPSDGGSGDGDNPPPPPPPDEDSGSGDDDNPPPPPPPDEDSGSGSGDNDNPPPPPPDEDSGSGSGDNDNPPPPPPDEDSGSGSGDNDNPPPPPPDENSGSADNDHQGGSGSGNNDRGPPLGNLVSTENTFIEPSGNEDHGDSASGDHGSEEDVDLSDVGLELGDILNYVNVATHDNESDASSNDVLAELDEGDDGHGNAGDHGNAGGRGNAEPDADVGRPNVLDEQIEQAGGNSGNHHGG